jgi:hypothetical protein
MIVKSGKKWLLKSKDGNKILGRHDSKDDAMMQEKAILISKARKKGDNQ